MKYVDPDGRVILGINETFNMSSYTDIYLGNSQTDKISTAGCYIVMFANIFSSSNYYQMSLTNSNKIEYDVNPFTTKKERSLERLVIGSDGSAWKTTDHYKSFERIE